MVVDMKVLTGAISLTHFSDAHGQHHVASIALFNHLFLSLIEEVCRSGHIMADFMPVEYELVRTFPFRAHVAAIVLVSPLVERIVLLVVKLDELSAIAIITTATILLLQKRDPAAPILRLCPELVVVG